MTELAPKHPMAWANLGSAEFRLGDSPGREASEESGAPRSERPAGMLTLGIIDYQKNDPMPVSLLSAKRFVSIRRTKAHLYLGVLIRKRGWLEGAEDEMRKAIRWTRNMPGALQPRSSLPGTPTSAIELARRHYYRALKLSAEHDDELDRVLKKRMPTEPALQAAKASSIATATLAPERAMARIKIRTLAAAISRLILSGADRNRFVDLRFSSKSSGLCLGRERVQVSRSV
jgi:hypothetical protein